MNNRSGTGWQLGTILSTSHGRGGKYYLEKAQKDGAGTWQCIRHGRQYEKAGRG